MLALIAKAALFLASFAGMEGVAWITHRYVMHGLLWCWHQSHHEPRKGWFELNDLFAVVFATPAIAAIWLGVNVNPWWLPAGLGITAYGAAYFFFHDGLVHRRFALPFINERGFWKTRIQAHRLHHAVSTRQGAVSFGFLAPLPARHLKQRLDAVRRDRAA